MHIGQKTVLITGASSGIGQAVAQRMADAGHVVYGTSRSERQVDGVIMLKMDVRSEVDVEAGIQRILSETGRLDILVANAGIGIAGSLEDTTIEEARMQFEINFFGSLRIIRAVLPSMRMQGDGAIIAISSIAGHLAIPFQSGYSASKFALEASMEALRSEVAPFGIRVCLVEPGDTKTGFTGARILAAGAEAGSSPYAGRMMRSIAKMAHDEQHGASPDKVAKVVMQTALSPNPPVRVAVGLSYKTILFLKRLLPNRLVAAILRSLYAS